MTATEIGRLIVVVWAIESAFGMAVTLLNLADAFSVQRIVDHDPAATTSECAIAKAHVRREALRIVVALIFFSIAVYTVAQILGVVPSTGGILVALGLVIANGIIVVNSENDRRLRVRLRRRVNGS